MLVRPLLALVLSALAAGALAQVNPALYEGADRLEKLIAGAKKEGELSLYTSAQANDIGAVAKAFEQKYGVKVNMWRASSAASRRRPIGLRGSSPSSGRRAAYASSGKSSRRTASPSAGGIPC